MPDDLDQELRRVARALVDAAPSPPLFPSDPELAVGRPRYRQRFGAAIAAVVALAAVAAIAVGISTTGSTQDASTLQAGQSAPTPASGPTETTVSTTCGDRPPRPIAIPEGFAGPVAGPINGAPHPPEQGQLVMYWTSGGEGIEMRWPLDPTMPNPFAPRTSLPADPRGAPAEPS